MQLPSCRPLLLVLMGCIAPSAMAQPASKSPPDGRALAAAALTRVQRHARAGRDMRADFRQVYRDMMRSEAREETGRLEVKRDGRARFTYLTPTHKEFIFDGQTAYFYEPEAGQVTLFDHFAGSVAAQSLAIIWGQGALSELFDPSLCEQGCPALGPGELAVTLRPTSRLPTVSQVQLVCRRDEIVRALLHDPLGNVTEYIFDHIERHETFAGRNFRFRVPEGVSILHGPSGEPTAPATRRAPEVPPRVPTEAAP